MPRAKVWGAIEALEYQHTQLVEQIVDDGCVCMVQKVPKTYDGITPTTCWSWSCPEKDSIIPPGAFRVSIEKRKGSSTRPHRDVLGYKAIKSRYEVQDSSKGPRYTMRGIGAQNEIWMCLRCFEALLEKILHYRRQEEPRALPSVSCHPLTAWKESILADCRRIPAFPGKYTLQPPFWHCFEKWKAVHRYQNRCDSLRAKGTDVSLFTGNGMVPDGFFLGSDMLSIYRDEKTRDLRGEMEGETYRGWYAEVTASECLNKSLSDALVIVAKRIGLNVEWKETGKRPKAMPPTFYENTRKTRDMFDPEMGTCSWSRATTKVQKAPTPPAREPKKVVTGIKAALFKFKPKPAAAGRRSALAMQEKREEEERKRKLSCASPLQTEPSSSTGAQKTPPAAPLP